MSLHQEKAAERVAVEADLFTWMTVHGNLLLALRHPGNQGPSANVARNFVEALEAVLLRGGILDQEDIDKSHEVEQQQGRLLRS